MDGKGIEGGEKLSLEQQMKNLLKQIEKEPVPDELRTLAEELQAAIQRRRGSSGRKDQ